MHHIPGMSNSEANILSQLPWYKECSPQKSAITMLPDKCFVNKVGSKIILFQEKQFCERGAPPINSIKLTKIQSNIWDKIQNDHRREALVTKLCIEKPTLFRDEDKLLYYEDWVYILPNKKLWEQLLNDNHDTPIAGHPKVFKTYELINCYYWWPSQLKDIKTYVKGCSTCQQNKVSRQKKATPLNLLRHRPWATGSSWGKSGQQWASLKGTVRASLRQVFDMEGECG